MDHDPQLIGFIESEVAILVRRATSLTTNRRLGVLDRSAYLLLRQLDAHGPLGVKALAEEFGLDISTVSRQAAALVSKNLAERIPDPRDGRASHFRITETGRKQLEETRRARFERYARLLEGWTDEERRTFGELLARFNRTFVD
ncbi:MarR family transcriptional regulator [Alicyclobacillus cycloheptanicus]|jgi:DNA-binding MarR family transcriptional regulator|uniref:DNA-binding MarR family transcriptional regulator n=1 Tax=Alicyclobacillus cycloheptanicus TaxID=1457 RepID=A0ABT9XMH2_9BACL|nr:MarR family transcriptional regulator [Alicyclobacillus cycloheptanicus]MDQ0191224.1 DNA-binding MarR family transcriptional regulator [Alicyclobacillus cycloheptanicus]WDM01537.1 MarR family transcriptional regulator [Alicyclobacillus cycloheptanicus]